MVGEIIIDIFPIIFLVKIKNKVSRFGSDLNVMLGDEIFNDADSFRDLLETC